MQDLIIFDENEVIIQSNGKDYQDTKDNFLLDYGKVIPQMSVAQIVQNDEDNKVVNELQDITTIDYNRNVKSCWLNGHAFQEYPNEVCEDILNSIDSLLEAKANREYVEPTLDELRTAKLTSLKSMRDTLEVEPITYNGNNFDYDEKARDRINAAIIALDMQTQATGTEASLFWTTADNFEAEVTANDLRGVISNVAIRSNELHIKYRNLKDKVKTAITIEELEAIEW